MTTDKIPSPKDVKPMSIKGQIGIDNKKELQAEQKFSQKHMINVKKESNSVTMSRCLNGSRCKCGKTTCFIIDESCRSKHNRHLTRYP